MAKMDARILINDNLQTVANQWHISIQELIDGVPITKPNLADKLDDVQKHSILSILDIDGTRHGIINIHGFSSNELQSMLDSIPTH